MQDNFWVKIKLQKNKFEDNFSNRSVYQHLTVQSASCISAFLLLQCKIITLVVHKLVCSCRQFYLESFIKKIFWWKRICATNWTAVLRGGHLISALQNFFYPNPYFCLHSTPFAWPQALWRSPRIGFGAFLFNASALLFVSGTGQRLTAHRLRIFVRPSGVCAGHTVKVKQSRYRPGVAQRVPGS